MTQRMQQPSKGRRKNQVAGRPETIACVTAFGLMPPPHTHTHSHCPSQLSHSPAAARTRPRAAAIPPSLASLYGALVTLQMYRCTLCSPCPPLRDRQGSTGMAADMKWSKLRRPDIFSSMHRTRPPTGAQRHTRTAEKQIQVEKGAERCAPALRENDKKKIHRLRRQTWPLH